MESQPYGEDIQESLGSWAQDYRTEQLRDSRFAEADALARATELTSFDALISDYASRRQPVSIRSISNARYNGVIVATSQNLVCLQTESSVVWMRSRAIVAIRAFGKSTTIALDEKPSEEPITLASVLAEAALNRVNGKFHLTGISEPVVGEIISCADDMIVVRTPQTHNPDIAIRIGAITELLLS